MRHSTSAATARIVPPTDEQRDHAVEVAPGADDAHDEVEDEHVAQEEREVLDDRRPGRVHARKVHRHREQHGQKERADRRLEPGRAHAHARIRRDGAQPAPEHDRDEDAIRLELERQLAADRVAPDRDEQDHDQDQPEQRRPGQQHPLVGGEHQAHDDEAEHQGRRSVADRQSQDDGEGKHEDDPQPALRTSGRSATQATSPRRRRRRARSPRVGLARQLQELCPTGRRARSSPEAGSSDQSKATSSSTGPSRRMRIASSRCVTAIVPIRHRSSARMEAVCVGLAVSTPGDGALRTLIWTRSPTGMSLVAWRRLSSPCRAVDRMDVQLAGRRGRARDCAELDDRQNRRAGHRFDRARVDLGRSGVLGDPAPHLVRQDQLRVEVRQRHEAGGVGEPDAVGALLLAERRSRQHHAPLRKPGLCDEEA